MTKNYNFATNNTGHFLARKKKRFFRRKKKRGGYDKATRSRNNAVTSVLSKGVNVRPDRILVKLPYEVNISMTGNTYYENQFNTNSLFDPDRTGAGHQPLGFDQWTNFYNRYLVFGVSYEIEFVNASASSVSYVGVVFDNDTSSLTASTCLEQPRGVNKLLGLASGSSRIVLKGYQSNAAITGVPKDRYNSDDTYSALYTANPSETIIAHIFARDSTISQNVSIACKVRLVYHCMLYDPFLLGQS